MRIRRPIRFQTVVKLALLSGVGLISSCQTPSIIEQPVAALEPTAPKIAQATTAPFDIPIGSPPSQPDAPYAGSGGRMIADGSLRETDPPTQSNDNFDDHNFDDRDDGSWPLTFYVPDATCDRLIPKTVTVQGDRPLEVAVGRVLVEVASDNLDLRGYRLQVNTQTRTATIALRLRPGSTHKFTGLSSCEQLTLFGSVRKTLIQNPDWPIDHVIFTDGAKPIRL